MNDEAKQQLKEFLDEKVAMYNRPAFVEGDPISIPHLYTSQPDREISGLFAALFSWGGRTTIIAKSKELMALMDNSPHEFVMGHNENELARFAGFAHRTFNEQDCVFVVKALRRIYSEGRGLEEIFTQGFKSGDAHTALVAFREAMMAEDRAARTGRHIANVATGSAAKRLNMYLRWMVRNDMRGVDFGIWKNISPAQLICPLDLHSGHVARRLGLLHIKKDNWLAALALTEALREFDPTDPVKYDFALFGMGVNEDLI